MTLLFDSLAQNETAILVLVVALAGAYLAFLILRLVLPGLLERWRPVPTEGAREAVLTERNRQLEACLGLLAKLPADESKDGNAATLLTEAAKVTGASRTALVLDGETWTGPGEAGSDAERALEQHMLLGLREWTEERGMELPYFAPRLALEPIEDSRGRLRGWLGAVRGGDQAAFPGGAHCLPKLTAVALFALTTVEERLSARLQREQYACALDALEQARRDLEQTKHLALQGELAQHMLHEMSNPMTGVLGLAEYLRNAIPEGDFRAELEQLIAEAVRCRRILEQFSVWSMNDAGPWEAALVPLDGVLREVLESMRHLFKKKGVQCSHRLPEGRIPYKIAADAVTRFFTDLLMAGLSYAEQGQGRVLVELARSGAGIQVDLLASRRGTPLPDQMPEIGEGWRDSDSLWKDLETLNLAVLKTLARSMDGTLQVGASDGLLHLRMQLRADRAPLRNPLVSSYLAPMEDLDPAPEVRAR
ncbi:MAG: sensor histidine kinase [Planctomycetota bacterium]